MTDREIQVMLQTAYGYSDEQLLAEFEAAERETRLHPHQEKGDYEDLIRRIEKLEKQNS